MLFNRLAEGSIDLPPFAVQARISKALAELRRLRAQALARAREVGGAVGPAPRAGVLLLKRSR
jgi:hypothetical protein